MQSYHEDDVHVLVMHPEGEAWLHGPGVLAIHAHVHVMPHALHASGGIEQTVPLVERPKDAVWVVGMVAR